MKKSQMIKRIAKLLSTTNASCMSHNEVALLIIDETNMTPPEIKNPRIENMTRAEYSDMRTVADVHNQVFKYEDEPYMVREWESEGGAKWEGEL